MKVTGRSESRLTLERRPWILGILLAAFILLFVGIGLVQMVSGEMFGGIMFAFVGGGVGFLGFWAFVRRTLVIMDRDLGTVTVRRRSLTGYTEEVLALADVQNASVQTSRGDKTDTHRPVLMMLNTPDDPVYPLVPVYVSGRGAGRVARAINEWLGLDDGPDR